MQDLKPAACSSLPGHEGASADSNFLLLADKTKTPIEILSLQLIPDPPKLGQDLTVKAKANLSELLYESSQAFYNYCKRCMSVCQCL